MSSYFGGAVSSRPLSSVLRCSTHCVRSGGWRRRRARNIACPRAWDRVLADFIEQRSMHMRVITMVSGMSPHEAVSFLWRSSRRFFSWHTHACMSRELAVNVTQVQLTQWHNQMLQGT